MGGMSWNNSLTDKGVALREIFLGKVTLSGVIRHVPSSSFDHNLTLNFLNYAARAGLEGPDFLWIWAAWLIHM